VLCWGRGGSTELARRAGYEVAATHDAFFASADVVTLHLPLNEATRGIITVHDLSHMKLTALLVNTSRATLISPNALVEASMLGQPGYAAVDVYEEEPMIDRNHPLLSMSNVICTPHLGYVQQRVYEGIYGTAVQQIVAFAAGSPINLATPS
jgi:D-3-phosphoglycerate dehydrogenase